MLKRSKFETTQSQIMHRAEDLISAASENNEDSMMKPVLRAIIEMSDELTQPEIIGDL
jgi:DNA-directed RNA polymerase subunit omega